MNQLILMNVPVLFMFWFQSTFASGVDKFVDLGFAFN